MKKHIQAAAAALVLAAPVAASAQSWYVGIAGGRAKAALDAGRVDQDLTQNVGFFTSSTSTDESGSTWRIFVGHRVLPWLDVEAHYADLGKARFDATVTPAGTLGASIRSKSFGVAAIGFLMPTPATRVYGKLGVASTQAEASFSSSGFVELEKSSETKRKTAGYYGVGAQYDFNRNLSARVEYDVHTALGGDTIGGKFDVKATQVGLVWRF